MVPSHVPPVQTSSPKSMSLELSLGPGCHSISNRHVGDRSWVMNQIVVPSLAPPFQVPVPSEIFRLVAAAYPISS